MTMRERTEAGKLFTDYCEGLPEDRINCKKRMIQFNSTMPDDGKIIIGKKVMFGPAVTIATLGHPVNPKMREYMYTDPVTIEDNCWIGAGTTICPGVHIGENSVIGAGSVVVHDIPANSVAAGNPCKVIREIGE